ncbi:zinc/cadmium/mercury/lead-transporting ATPase, partial [Klebsiella pneumoniae]
STPAAITSGLAVAARRGALIKGGAALEQLGQVRQVAFDKTGTLTVGQPQVTSVIATAEVDDNALLALAAAVEQGSSHPLAQAIVREAQRRQLSIPLASGQRALAGSGIEAEVNGSRILICAASKAAPAEHEAQIQQLESAGQTVVLVMRGETLLGILALRDTLRDDARQAVDALHQLGVQGVI